MDAAIGGKTAINLSRGKNLVGTFYQPLLVVSDVETLRTLPRAELVAGLAEVAKYGFIADPALLELLEAKSADIVGGEPHLLTDVVTRSTAIKARVVEADERDRDRRAILNYGHTFAHALEQSAGYSGLRHGEAVAVGMMAAAHLACVMGRIDEEAVRLHRRVLEAVGLPVTASLDVARLEEAWRRDKKYRGGVRFVLLKAIGDAEVGVAVERDAIVNAVERLSG